MQIDKLTAIKKLQMASVSRFKAVVLPKDLILSEKVRLIAQNRTENDRLIKNNKEIMIITVEL